MKQKWLNLSMTMKENTRLSILTNDNETREKLETTNA